MPRDIFGDIFAAVRRLLLEKPLSKESVTAYAAGTVGKGIIIVGL